MCKLRCLTCAALAACCGAFISSPPTTGKAAAAAAPATGAPKQVAFERAAQCIPWPRRRQLSLTTAAGDGSEDLPHLTQDEVRRYSRHLILPDVGVEGQRRLKASSVLAIGAGGLGSPALLYLAAAGVGRVGIVDDDVVDESNLQRQVIHGTSTLGVSKVESARTRILDINPHVQVELYPEQLTSDNALDIIKGYDVVLDGSDNFPTKYLVNDACVLQGVPNVYGAILGFEGQVSVFSYKGGPNYRDLLPVPPNPGDVPSCAEGGVLGILPGVIGCIQATEVIKILLGKGDVLSGRLLIYDALKMTFKESALLPRSEPIAGLVDYQGFCGFAPKSSAAAAAAAAAASAAAHAQPPPRFERVSAQAAAERLASGWSPFVLDVRLPQEAKIASLPFADMVVPHREVARVAAALPRDRDILVHCKVGGRSSKACETLAALGFERLYNLEGGIIAWANEIDRSLAVY
ncbi:molybdopterin biosynthesis protein MoeB [Tribonema minus]|uniref:Molybdopterin biosynthesis protein MoeB n=1 Tax=Tribonema minus TaxID=303371 RepID=A0A836CQ68_9STRA|nr:molybdopterin biosynthesis protein MoeB [Tribonema minus]